FSFAVLAIGSERSNGLPMALWVLLIGAFGFDATVTLVRRVLNGDRWYSAHRSHAYQRLVIAGWSHQRVVTSLIFLNAALGGLVFAAWRLPSLVPLCLVLGLVLLGGAYAVIERIEPMHAAPMRSDRAR
ncbi:MAG TPA: hypothetical protein VFT29_15605, partial [Gemmatimonadaceae bacterium]|nr:hypothetical protein [Gemmatimonadaceae bacterium]